MKYVAYGLIGLLSLVPTLSPLPARAESPQEILISEVNWAGSPGSTADEWLELINNETYPVDISGWQILGAATGGTALIFPAESVIAPHSVYLIANYPQGDVKTTVLTQPGYVTSSVALANTNLHLELKDQNGNLIDIYDDTGAPEFGQSTPEIKSIERNLETRAWETSISSRDLLLTTQYGTPGNVIWPAVTVDEPVVAVPTVEETIHESSLSPEITDTSLVETAAESPPEETPATEEIPSPIEEVVPTIEPVIEETPKEEAVVIPPEVIYEIVELIPSEPAEETPAPVPVVTASVSTPVVAPTVSSASAHSPITPPKSYEASRLLINEFVSDPESGVEWIEIMNPGDTLSLEGWTIRDGSGKPTLLTGTIAKNGYFVLENPLGKLNNDGDEIILLDPAQHRIDSIIYGNDQNFSPKKGESLARHSDTWNITLPSKNQSNPEPISVAATPGESNDPINPSLPDPETPSDTLESISPSPERGTESVSASASGNVTVKAASEKTTTTKAIPPKTTAPKKTATKAIPQVVTIEQIPDLREGTLIQTEGMVVATPGLYGKQIAFLSGLELYFSKATWPDLALSSYVRVTGTLDAHDGNMRLKIASAEGIETLPRPSEEVPIPDLAHDTPHGALASVTGEVGKRTSKMFVLKLEDGSELDVKIPTGLSVNASTLKGNVTVTGVVRLKNGVRTLTLREATDIIILASDTPATDTMETASAPVKKRGLLGYSLFGGSLSVLSALFLRYKFNIPA